MSLFVFFYGLFCILLCVLCIVSYILRDKPGFSGIWKCFKIFFIVAFVNLTGNFIKKEVKAWWNKD